MSACDFVYFNDDIMPDVRIYTLSLLMYYICTVRFIKMETLTREKLPLFG